MNEFVKGYALSQEHNTNPASVPTLFKKSDHTFKAEKNQETLWVIILR